MTHCLGRAVTALAASGGALAVALLVGALLILAAGANPWHAYMALADGAVGSAYALGVSLQKTTPLVLTGLSVLLAFRGAERLALPHCRVEAAGLEQA